MTFNEIETLYPGWEVTSLLGEGAFGAVYEIRRDVFGREQVAALKVIHIPQNQSEVQQLRTEGMDEESVKTYFYGFVEALSDEIGLLSKLTGHSNIVSYQDHQILPDSGKLGWTILIRMELLKPLKKQLLEEPMQEGDILQLGLDIARALEICERNQIIHRDIKPDNIFLSSNGDYKLGDFGVARELEKTTAGLSARKGTLAYMAPEVFNGKPYNATADIYSLGVVLYTLLNSNRTPFLPPAPRPITWQDRETAQIKLVSNEPLPVLPDVPAELMAVILKMAAKDPAERYRSAGEMNVALESAATSFLSGNPEPLPAPVVAPPLPDPVSPNHDAKTVALWANQPAPPAPEPVEHEESLRLDSILLRPAVSDTATTMTIPGQPHREKQKKKNWLTPVLAAVVVVLAAMAVWAIALKRDNNAQAQALAPPAVSVSAEASTVATDPATTVTTTTKAPTTAAPTSQKPTTATTTTTQTKNPDTYPSYLEGKYNCSNEAYRMNYSDHVSPIAGMDAEFMLSSVRFTDFAFSSDGSCGFKYFDFKNPLGKYGFISIIGQYRIVDNKVLVTYSFDTSLFDSTKKLARDFISEFGLEELTTNNNGSRLTSKTGIIFFK